MKADILRRGRASKTVNPEQMWRQECQRAREVLAQKQRVIDAMWQAGQQKQEERKG